MVGHKRERVLGRVGRAVNAAARDFAREAAQLENGGGREAAAERLVEQQVEVVALDKDRVVVETAMRALTWPWPFLWEKGWPGCPRALLPMFRRRAGSSLWGKQVVFVVASAAERDF